MSQSSKKKTQKKTQKNKSSLALQDNLSHPMQTVYMLLAMMGVISEESDLKIRYEGHDYNVSIALPLIKYAIAFDGDTTTGLEEDGWHIEYVSYNDIEPFSRVFFSVDNARVAEMYARADPNVKTTSIPEEKLLIEFKRRRMPEPDRNYKFTRDDGTELTTPDFTWEDLRLAFFMDGSYWHSVKSDKEIIKEIKSSRKMQDTIVEKRKDKARKDGAIRSELAARGWTVLSCTDDDIETSEGLKDVVDMVERAISTITSVNKVVSEKHMDEKKGNSIAEFLNEHAKNSGDNDNQDENSDDIEHEEDSGENDSPKTRAHDVTDDTSNNAKDTQSDAQKESIIDFINSYAGNDNSPEDDSIEDNHGYSEEFLRYDEM